MARIRSLKPEFWTDGNVVKLSPFARLLFMGSWNFALCDQGHLSDDAMGLKLKILPADNVDPDALLGELIALGRVVRRRTPDGRSYLHVVRLSDHQKIDPRWSSKCPYCAIETEHGVPRPEATGTHESNGNSPRLPETPRSYAEPPQSSAQDGIGGDGIGGESTSPPASPVPPKGDATRRRPRAAAKQQGTRLPDIFPVTEDMAAWARENTPGCGLGDHESFCDYWRSVPGAKGLKLDWIATWRNWMRSEHKKRPRAANGSAHTTNGHSEESTGTQRARAAVEAGRELQAMIDRGEVAL